MKILNFGSMNIDYVYNVSHMVQAGETLASDALNVYCGGKGLNQSVAAARAGGDVWHAGLIGSEGAMLEKVCKESGVNTDLIRETEGKSGHTIIQVDRSGQNCILLYGGANRQISTEYVNEVMEHFSVGDVLLLQNEISSLDYIIEQAYKMGMRIVLNPSPFDENLKACNLSLVSLFLLNEVEGEQMTGSSDPDTILARMAELYPESEVILTLGQKGSVYSFKGKTVHQKIYPVKAVDTTAAGDTYTGYYLAAVVNGKSVEEALDLAARASAIAVTRSGAVPSIPKMEEVLAYTGC